MGNAKFCSAAMCRSNDKENEYCPGAAHITSASDTVSARDGVAKLPLGPELQVRPAAKDDLVQAKGPLPFSSSDIDLLRANTTLSDVTAGSPTNRLGLCKISAEELAREDTETFQAIIDAYRDDPSFMHFSQGSIVLQKLHEDEIIKGVNVNMTRDLIVRSIVSSSCVHKAQKLDALFQTPDQVAEKIIESVGIAQDKLAHVHVIVLSGSRASGKGKVKAKLLEKLPHILERSGKKSRLHHWKVGTLFRAITFLAITYKEQHACSLQEALDPSLLDLYSDLIVLTEELQWAIVGMGMRYTLRDIENGLLRFEQVSSSVAEVAECCQGYVIKLIIQKLQLVLQAKETVLLEGHPATLRFIDTPHKFEFMLDDDGLLGQWLTAKVVAARALQFFALKNVSPSEAIARAVLALQPFSAGTDELDDSIERERNEIPKAMQVLGAYKAVVPNGVLANGTKKC